MTAHRMQFPEVPGKTPREKFENLARMMFAVPKAEIEEKKRPKKRRKRAAAIAGVLVLLLFGSLSGCTIHAKEGNPIVMDNNIVGQITEGTSTKADLRRLLGEPTKTEFTGTNGDMEVWKYVYGERDVRFLSGNSDTRIRVVSVLLGADGVVKKVTVTNPTASVR